MCSTRNVSKYALSSYIMLMVHTWVIVVVTSGLRWSRKWPMAWLKRYKRSRITNVERKGSLRYLSGVQLGGSGWVIGCCLERDQPPWLLQYLVQSCLRVYADFPPQEPSRDLEPVVSWLCILSVLHSHLALFHVTIFCPLEKSWRSSQSLAKQLNDLCPKKAQYNCRFRNTSVPLPTLVTYKRLEVQYNNETTSKELVFTCLCSEASGQI